MEQSQEEYRKLFGIEDKFLIQTSYDVETGEGYIVYIDMEDDINWNDTRNDFFQNEEGLKYNQWLAKLNLAYMEPCSNLTIEEKLTFRKKLAVGYALLLVKDFKSIPNVIDESLCYLKARNREISRTLFLDTSVPIVLIATIVWIINFDFIQWHLVATTGCYMGILGSYISIWIRFGKTQMTGLSSKCLHIIETIARLIAGGIFAIVSYYAICCGIKYGNYSGQPSFIVMGFIGFVSGFSEKLIPDLVEKFSKSAHE